MKKILLVTTGLSSVGDSGGISSYVHDLATNLSERKYIVTVFLVSQSINKETPSGIKYSLKKFEIPRKRSDEYKVVGDLLSAIEELSPAIIINNDTSYIAGLWPVLDPNIIRISIMHGFSERITSTNYGIQGKIAVYNSEYIDYIVFQNREMMRLAAKKYNLPHEKLKCIHQTVLLPNSIDKNVDDNIFTIVFAGGNMSFKGADTMYKIANKLKDLDLNFRLYWCLPALNYANKFIGDDRFIFLGKKSKKDFLSLLAKSACIVIPTKMDTGPLLVVEALSVGSIPICNNLINSSIPDLIENGINGFRIENNCVEQYLDIINKLYTDLDLRIKMRNRGMIFYQEKLSPNIQINEFEKLFVRTKSLPDRVKFSDKNIIHFHNWSTKGFSKFSLKRIMPKILNSLEIVLTENNYRKLRALGL